MSEQVYKVKVCTGHTKKVMMVRTKSMGGDYWCPYCGDGVHEEADATEEMSKEYADNYLKNTDYIAGVSYRDSTDGKFEFRGKIFEKNMLSPAHLEEINKVVKDWKYEG